MIKLFKTPIWPKLYVLGLFVLLLGFFANSYMFSTYGSALRDLMEAGQNPTDSPAFVHVVLYGFKSILSFLFLFAWTKLEVK